MGLAYRLILPAKEVALVYPYFQESNAVLEFATLGSVDTGLLPQVWAYGPDRDQLAEQLIAAPALNTISKQLRCPDCVRYRVDWDPTIEAVVELKRLRTLLRDLRTTVLVGRITPTEWAFVCDFPTQKTVLDCYTECAYSNCRLTRQTDLDFAKYHPDRQ